MGTCTLIQHPSTRRKLVRTRQQIPPTNHCTFERERQGKAAGRIIEFPNDTLNIAQRLETDIENCRLLQQGGRRGKEREREWCGVGWWWERWELLFSEKKSREGKRKNIFFLKKKNNDKKKKENEKFFFKKKKGPKEVPPVTLCRSFFKTFHGVLFMAFRELFGALPHPEKEGPTPQARKEANFHPQTAGPTFIAKGQPPFQEGPTPLQGGMANTDSKKEGPTTSEEKNKPEKERPTHHLEKEGPIRRKGQNPHLKDRTNSHPKNDRPNPNPREEGLIYYHNYYYKYNYN